MSEEFAKKKGIRWNPENIRRRRMKNQKDKVTSYNAGYHRGLNTEYHDVPVEELFVKWVADVRRPPAGSFDLTAFEAGFRDGLIDYDFDRPWVKREKHMIVSSTPPQGISPFYKAFNKVESE